jgi:hypothetical protein
MVVLYRHPKANDFGCGRNNVGHVLVDSHSVGFHDLHLLLCHFFKQQVLFDSSGVLFCRGLVPWIGFEIVDPVLAELTESRVQFIMVFESYFLGLLSWVSLRFQIVVIVYSFVQVCVESLNICRHCCLDERVSQSLKRFYHTFCF